MDTIRLERQFRVWRYGVGHLQLQMHSPASNSDLEHMTVLFEGVRAIKLRTSYQPLVLQPAEPHVGAGILEFANLTEPHASKHLCLTLPSENDGFIVCGRATVFTTPTTEVHADAWWPQNAKVIATLRR